MSEFQIFSYKEQQVRTVERGGEVWLVAKDVCDILEIANARDAISALDDDEKASVAISDGSQIRHYNAVSESGIYALIFRSNKPEAKQFSKWIRKEVLPSIRKAGSCSTTPRMSREEYELRMNELIDRRKMLDLRGAQILQSLLDNNTFPCTPEARTVFSHEIFKLITGHEYLAMLSESTEKWYRAGDIASAFGLSVNTVNRIAKKHGLKATEGESNEYGRWIFSKSRYSSREVASFIYSEAGFEWFREYQAGMLSE